MDIMNNTARLIADLVGIDSVNPSLIPGAAGEAEIAQFVGDWLRERGIKTQIHEAAPGRPSVTGRVRGQGKGRSILLNAHLDTVGVAGMPEPFKARLENGKMYGRGAYDMKGSLAACMLALEEVRSARLAGDVILAAVADEEHSSIGTQNVLKHIRADAAIVTEPTSLQVCIAHKGFSWHEITTLGSAAHGSRPDLGIDAIAHMGRVLQSLELLQTELGQRSSHPLLGNASLHASLISGGQELSSYPATCVLQMERRTLPDETMTNVEAELHEVLKRLSDSDLRFQSQMRTTLVRPPFSVPADADIVRTLTQEAAHVLGRTPNVIGASFWMDAAFFAEAGIPTVAFGPHGAGAHSVDEWVDLESVDRCREILVRTIRAYQGGAGR
jgi:acetylornithine deacetylase